MDPEEEPEKDHEYVLVNYNITNQLYKTAKYLGIKGKEIDGKTEICFVNSEDKKWYEIVNTAIEEYKDPSKGDWIQINILLKDGGRFIHIKKDTDTSEFTRDNYGQKIGWWYVSEPIFPPSSSSDSSSSSSDSSSSSSDSSSSSSDSSSFSPDSSSFSPDSSSFSPDSSEDMYHESDDDDTEEAEAADILMSMNDRNTPIGSLHVVTLRF